MTRTRVHAADGQLTEAAFQMQIISLARFYEWAVYHPPDNRPAGGNRRVQAGIVRGYPDLTLVRAHELIFAELKRDSTYPSREQRDWLERLTTFASTVPLPAVVDVFVWRPRDRPEIEKRLSTIHGGVTP